MLKHKEGGWISNVATDGITKGEAKTYNNPQHADHTHCNKALEHCGNNVFGVDHASIEIGKPGVISKTRAEAVSIQAVSPELNAFSNDRTRYARHNSATTLTATKSTK